MDFRSFKFRKNIKGLLLPVHEVPNFHEDVLLMSFHNFKKISASYREIIGLRNITHFSINIVDPEGKMSIISFNPQISFNIIQNGTYLYNGSISPSFYNAKELYSWDECYDPRYKQMMINTMELKNNIKKGVVITRRSDKFTFLYSFATKFDGNDFYSDIYNNTDDFYKMGSHCYSLIKQIYQDYSPLPVPNPYGIKRVK